MARASSTASWPRSSTPARPSSRKAGRCTRRSRAARLRAAWVSPPQGRQHVLEPRRRPRGRPAQSAQGLGVDRRGRHRASVRRGRAAARARRAAGAPRQRGGRHRDHARPQDRALQPPLRGDVRLRARARPTAPGGEVVLHRRGIRAARRHLRRARPGPHARARAVAAAPGRLGLLVPRLGPRRSPPATRRAATSGCSRTSASGARADEALERLVREQDAVLQNAVTGIIFVKDRHIVR